jgi:hypothetical protein
MNEANGAKTAGMSLTVWGLALAAVALAAGVAYWMKATDAEASPQSPVVSTLKGASFDDAPSPSATIESRGLPAALPDVRKEETPAPAPAEPKPSIAPAPAVVEKPVERPAPPPASELKTTPPPVAAKPAEAKSLETNPAEAKAEEAKPAEKQPAAEDEKPEWISFSKLVFRYWPKPKDDKGARDPIPAPIRAMNGKRIIIDGYMFPVDFEKGKVKNFLLSRAMFGCCYGDSPQITEVIKVMRADGKTMPFEALARVTGILEVGEEVDSEGYIDSIYRIKADSVGSSPSGKR